MLLWGPEVDVPSQSVGRPNRTCGEGRCGRYVRGHDVHIIPARLAAESPWGWRDGLVVEVRGSEVTVDYLRDEGSPVLWHHRPLGRYVANGDPVRVHEKYHLLSAADQWYSVVVSDGLGPVVEPELPELWVSERSAVVVDLAGGVGLSPGPSGRET